VFDITMNFLDHGKGSWFCKFVVLVVILTTYYDIKHALCLLNSMLSSIVYGGIDTYNKGLL